MSDMYLVKDGDRTVTLATEHNNRLYGYVANLDAFVYNGPMSIDFLVDRRMTYELVDADAAAAIVKAGTVGRLDGRIFKDLLDELRAETRRLDPNEVLGAAVRANPDPTPTEAAKDKADQLRHTDPGHWIVYKTYPAGASKQTALQLASDLRKGRVRAFAGISLKSRVVSSVDGRQVVQVTREPQPADELTAEAAGKVAKARSGPRRSAAQVAKSRRRRSTAI